LATSRPSRPSFLPSLPVSSSLGAQRLKISYRHYEDSFAADPRIDQLREKMVCVEDEQYSRDYLDPEKRSIANALQIEFADGSRTEKVSTPPSSPLGDLPLPSFQGFADERSGSGRVPAGPPPPSSGGDPTHRGEVHEEHGHPLPAEASSSGSSSTRPALFFFFGLFALSRGFQILEVCLHQDKFEKLTVPEFIDLLAL
jgi:hypothetical protein